MALKELSTLILKTTVSNQFADTDCTYAPGGDTLNNLSVLRNSFLEANIDSGSASVLIDDESAVDATVINLKLLGNAALPTEGEDAYRLNQVDPGEFNIFGDEATAQEVVENNNQGEPVTITGTINVVQ